jgi:hypothetical protein
MAEMTRAGEGSRRILESMVSSCLWSTLAGVPPQAANLLADRGLVNPPSAPL